MQKELLLNKIEMVFVPFSLSELKNIAHLMKIQLHDDLSFQGSIVFDLPVFS